MSQQLSTITMTLQEQALLQEQAVRLAAQLQASDRSVRRFTEPPVPGKRMETAKKANLYDAYEQGYRLMFSAEDHLRALLGTLTGNAPVPIFAPFTLVRAAADPLVRCRHLVDPRISESNRLARGLNERLDNLAEQRKVQALLPGQEPAAKKHYSDCVAHLEKRATVNGITPVPDKTGKTIGFNERVPEDIELFAAHLPGGVGSLAFRVLSGYVHSKSWIQYDPSDAQATADPNFKVIPASLDVPTFAAVLKAILDLHDTCVANWLELAGYPPEVWAGAKAGR